MVFFLERVGFRVYLRVYYCVGFMVMILGYKVLVYSFCFVLRVECSFFKKQKQIRVYGVSSFYKKGLLFRV
jgi:hypothetical protein